MQWFYVQAVVYEAVSIRIKRACFANEIDQAIRRVTHLSRLYPVAGGADSNTNSAGRGAVESGLGRLSPKSSGRQGAAASRRGKKYGSQQRGRDDGRDGDDRRQRQNSIWPYPDNASWQLACPFYLHNRHEHWNCLNYELNRIVDVRQHIYRHHALPSYCPHCGVEFPNDSIYAQRDSHMANCEVTGQQFRRLGATSDQLESMSNAATHRRGLDESARWYVIWDIMFPGENQPLSPYIDVSWERNCREVSARFDYYLQNGGPRDFSQYTNGLDLSNTMRIWMYHILNFDLTVRPEPAPES